MGFLARVRIPRTALVYLVQLSRTVAVVVVDSKCSVAVTQNVISPAHVCAPPAGLPVGSNACNVDVADGKGNTSSSSTADADDAAPLKTHLLNHGWNICM